MQVIDSFMIRGRGWVVCVRDAPPTHNGPRNNGVRIGDEIAQGSRTWEITGIECFASYFPQTTLGFLVRSTDLDYPKPRTGSATIRSAPA